MDNNVETTDAVEQQVPAQTEGDGPSFSFVSDEEVNQINSPVEAPPEPQAEVQNAEPPSAVEEQTQPEAPVEQSTNKENQAPEDVEGTVIQYLSEKLGREVQSIDEFIAPQQESELDERISAIADFVQETGRSPQDWFIYQQLNPSEMDDMTAIQVQMSSEYPNLSQDEVSTLLGSKYKLDPDLHTEDEVKLSQLKLKIDAQDARQGIDKLRSKYSAPEVSNSEDVSSPFDEQWVASMRAKTEDLGEVEFDLGNGKDFKFGLDDKYRSELMEKNTRLDEFFDPYVQKDGNWDYDKLNVHRAVIDNMQTIVQSVYKQGMADGQRGIVNQAANVSAQTPNQEGRIQEDTLAAQLKQAMGGTSNWSF